MIIIMITGTRTSLTCCSADQVVGRIVRHQWNVSPTISTAATVHIGGRLPAPLAVHWGHYPCPSHNTWLNQWPKHTVQRLKPTLNPSQSCCVVATAPYERTRTPCTFFGRSTSTESAATLLPVFYGPFASAAPRNMGHLFVWRMPLKHFLSEQSYSSKHFAPTRRKCKQTINYRPNIKWSVER